MHSSRVHTNRCSDHPVGGGRPSQADNPPGRHPPPPAQDRHLPLYHTPLLYHIPPLYHTPSPCEQIDACENITFLHTSYAVGN